MEIAIDNKAVRVATGGRTHEGDEAPAVVFIHGSGMDRTTWQMQSRWFAHHGFRVAAIDLPGHGLSEGPPLETIEEMADWTARVIGELELGAAHVVGFSLGTFVALELAARHGESVASLVLVGTASAMPVHPQLLDDSFTNRHRASRLVTSWGLGSRGHIGGHASPGMWLVGSSTALLDTSPDGALGADMAACNAYTNAVEAASSLHVPVAFVLGREDKMTPVRASTDLVDAVRVKNVVVLESIGHMMPIEDPIRVRNAIHTAIRTAIDTSDAASAGGAG